MKAPSLFNNIAGKNSHDELAMIPLYWTLDILVQCDYAWKTITRSILNYWVSNLYMELDSTAYLMKTSNIVG